jgi:signal transduction histidine kinase
MALRHIRRRSVGVNTTLIDGPRFETALLNLIVNAGDAMPGGGTLDGADSASPEQGAGPGPITTITSVILISFLH